MNTKTIILTLALTVSFASWNCKGGFNLFPVDQDKALGLQVSQQINSNNQEFPVMPVQGNEEIYRYVRNITQKLLNTGAVEHRNDFAWEVQIIDDDNTLNAFCTPGGYIYVYTGLIKFLDNEDQLAGVMGHEIAHAAMRHSTRQMSSMYGVDILRQIALGNQQGGQLADVAVGLTSLSFSRKHEREADEKSVIYLKKAGYSCDGTAGFFRKMLDAQQPPKFLSTHPHPKDRVEDIENDARKLGCVRPNKSDAQYNKMKALL